MAKDRIKELKRVPAGELIPNAKNWRTHPAGQVNAMQGILAEVGWADAVLARETPDGLELIDGHLRKEVAPDDMIPVLVLDVDEAEADKILATHDPLAAMAESNAVNLEALLHEVKTGREGLQQMLTDLADDVGIESMKQTPKIVEDEPPPPPADPITKPGDLWKLGRHRLLCGDSTNDEDVARLMDGEKAQLAITDPPYGVDYDGGTTKREKLRGDCSASLYTPTLMALALHTDDRSAAYVWHSDSRSLEVADAAGTANFLRRSLIIWNKNIAQFGALSAQYKTKHEFCLYLFKKGHAPRWYGPTNEVTVWDIDRNSRNENHPTEKPIEVMARPMRNSSASGDLVLDLFLGSGTTLIAAEQLERRCYGMEIDPAYCDVIVQRWENLTGKKASRE